MPPPAKPSKFYFFYGRRKPSQNRPTVYGGLFSNRQTINPNSLNSLNPNFHQSQKPANFNLQNWDPDSQIGSKPSQPKTPSENFFHIGQKLSPIARFICDSFRKHQRWGPEVIADLSKLRRVNPDMVAEVLKVQDDPNICSKFFHWAGKQKGYQHTYLSYNAFAYCLNRLNKFRAADQIPELMHMQGRPPSEKQFEILIRMHADNNRGLRVYYVYEKMKKFEVKPRVFLYNRIMDALVKTGHLDLAMLVYNDFKKDGLVEETVTYMILIKGLCKGGRIDEMLELLGQMRSLLKPDVFAYTAMIRILVGEGNLDGCLKVWNEMEKDKVLPDAMAYTTLISALCKGNRVDKAYELFKGMKNRRELIDRAIYGALVDGFVADGKVGSALDLLKDMMDSGYRADLSIYNTLIQGLCNLKQLDKAYKLFQVTVNEGLQPDFATVNPMLISYAESRKMDDYCKLLVQMQKLGSPVIDGLSGFFSLMVEMDERLPCTLEVFKDLKNKGYCSLSIYNILLGALYKVRQPKEALSFFEEMKDSNFAPDSTTYSHAIMCLVDLEDVREACLWYNKIKEMGSIPSIAAYCSLANGLCKIGEIDAAISLVQDCLGNVSSGPMELKYTLSIIHACKSNDADKVIEVVDEMLHQGGIPSEIIYCAVISGMCKHGTLEEARKVFSSMKEQKYISEANVIFYDDMLMEHMKKKTADLVLSGLKFFGLESKLKSKGSTLLPS
ncbi:pentatricopeptide repeat-containing protein At4g20740-like [Chenopodium quinoa]|uniref:pentatricopeptide repeat-containing protein At4g20740-like n=1 Tax=Chenopodium quinoa TaxID=63459 RepID=UPI000B76FCC4|nr:pentatricopeptide repeat-containing protein At4g20740-like [Chenopodium quinoa]XP_021774389.1 pentatricopeptide repeat-containing protein At4g20740-like [Chenopodium quinoa]XP_021774391.1 pentatricopeptide repeat-containing protein At4g20740-like [Chenopodium quinoa]